jgi:very-short-patch-repair endonuclease
MRDYLEYAETGAILDRGTDSAGGFENPFEESVARCLSDMDVEVVPQVGVAGFFIDLGVRLPGRSDYILGIECDGATYHSAKSARDRDAIRQAVIESKGWTIHRIWSTDWFNNREHAIDRLHRSLQRAASDQGLAKLI